MKCPITGEINCKCDKNHHNMSHGDVSIQDTLIKLFSDHAVFLHNFTGAFLDDAPFAAALKKRVLQNVEDLSAFLKNITNDDIGNEFYGLFTEHIKGGEEALKAVKMGDKHTLEKVKEKIFENSKKVSELISSINPKGLPLNVVNKEFDKHNEYELEIGKLHFNKDYTNEIKKYDEFYNHMIMFAKFFANGLGMHGGNRKFDDPEDYYEDYDYAQYNENGYNNNANDNEKYNKNKFNGNIDYSQDKYQYNKNQYNNDYTNDLRYIEKETGHDNDEMYKQKYIKYKNKYLNEKKNMIM